MKFFRNLSCEQTTILLSSRYFQFVLPTELVADFKNWDKPQLPQVGRYWPIHTSGAGLFGGDSAPLGGRYVYQFLVEYYVDCGDDGHTDYRLRGYVICLESELEHLTKIDPWGRSTVEVNHETGEVTMKEIY